MGDRNLINKVSDELKKHHVTIATAESCTGGLLAHTLTNVSGSSAYFDRGVISYSNQAKTQLLDIPENLIQKHGAVSKEVAAAMANAIRQNAQVDYGIATTGLAGPTGDTKDKPVGLVYIAVSTKDSIVVKQFLFSGDRLSNKESTCTAALELLLETLSQKKG
ncbi:MAG TPA: CinA family protein [Candidatus Thermoplasmatota archaeon]|nr:CinA family protein [Candidatus Thermoplasmatota archaeon]